MRGLQEGWFALPDPALTAQFDARYTAAYGDAPHPIAALAYDGIAAIGALIGTGAPDALSAASLTQGSGFVGVNGVFRLMPDGTNQRGLAVATIRNNAVVILDPAPRSFAGSGCKQCFTYNFASNLRVLLKIIRKVFVHDSFYIAPYFGVA